MQDKTLRQIFGDFKKSKVCYDLIPKLLKHQLYTCPITRISLNMGSKFDLSHIIPLSVLEAVIRPKNEQLAIILTTHHSNLFLEDRSSNRKRKDKIDDQILPLIEDLMSEFSELKMYPIIPNESCGQGSS